MRTCHHMWDDTTDPQIFGAKSCGASGSGLVSVLEAAVGCFIAFWYVLSRRDEASMDGRPSIISGLKAKHFQHILDLSQGDFSSSQSSSSSEGNVRQGRPTTPECTCPCRPRVEESTCPRDEHPRDITASGIGHVRAPLHLPDDGALAEEALGMLSPAEKDEVILRMHAKLRHLGGLVEEASTTSARTAARLARTHTDALREQMLSEQRLNEELLRWRHHHPEVAELREENARLRDENRQNQRQYLAVLGKLTRRKKLLKTAL